MHAPSDKPGGSAALAEAERARERSVAHCAAGMGRTGLFSSAWLCSKLATETRIVLGRAKSNAKGGT
jgi:protein-tyrosine phosphatase